MTMHFVDYVQLAEISDSDTLTNTCIQLATSNPNWDWSIPPKTNNPRVLNAYNKVCGIVFADSLFFRQVANPFMLRWLDRGSGLPVSSDHMLVTNRFEVQYSGHESHLFALRISTWNIMNKCHSKGNCAEKDIYERGLYSNNPENLDETVPNYRERKNIQINQIVEHITNQSKLVDALFLQEIDFLTMRAYNDLRDNFISKLHAAGFDIVMTTPDMNVKAQAIIYNKHVLQLNTRDDPPRAIIRGADVECSERRNTVFEVNFTHIRTGHPVTLASAHLAYDGNYSRILRNYSAYKASRYGSVVIWGGDTNHAPGSFIQGLTGDFHQATNYHSDEISGYTTAHAGTGKSKAYDGFGFCPPPNAVIRSYEESGWRFATSSDGSQISVKQIGLDSCRMHVSLVGRPWVRRQVLILEDLAYKDKLISSICEDVYNLHLADNKIIYLVTNDLLSCHTTSDIQKVFNKLTNFHEDAISPKTLRLFEHMQSLLRDDKRLLEELSFKESGSFHSAYGNDGNDTGNYYTP